MLRGSSLLSRVVRPAIRHNARQFSQTAERIAKAPKQTSMVWKGLGGAALALGLGYSALPADCKAAVKPRNSPDFDPAKDIPDDVDPRDAYWLPMGDDWHEGRVMAYIENPTGAQNKYEYDHDTHTLQLDRVLHTAISYPMDYGFIPRTLSEDGDALDVCVISFFPLLPGTTVSVRVVGVLLMEDEKGIDEKLLAVVDKDPRSEHYQRLDHLPPHVKKEISHFFERYKDLEPGKWAKVGAWLDKAEAVDIVKQCHKRFTRYYGRPLPTPEAPPASATTPKKKAVKATKSKAKDKK